MRRDFYLSSPFVIVLLSAFLLASCKKDKKDTPAPVITNFATIGLYEYAAVNGTATNRRVFIPITTVGNVQTAYLSVFDTGSTGMTMDANGLIPSSAITANGITVAGDSTVYNGITVTSQTAIISYGGVGSLTQEYGNLAYATVTIGDQNGKVTTGRIPFFLYYKTVNQTTGQTLPAHSNDVFGVGPGTSYSSSAIASPLSYFTLPSNLTNGFKLAMFNSSSFSTTTPTYVAGLLSIGLTPNDVSSSGFIMHPQVYFNVGGYSPNIVGTITYNGTSVAATIMFDTGTPNITILENPNAASNVTTLPANSSVTISTSRGFSYSYTTSSTYNSTQVDNPSYSQDTRSIFSIDFFLSNEYLLDYTNHYIGLKNN
jgi:hypothetical protein